MDFPFYKTIKNKKPTLSAPNRYVNKNITMSVAIALCYPAGQLVRFSCHGDAHGCIFAVLAVGDVDISWLHFFEKIKKLSYYKFFVHIGLLWYLICVLNIFLKIRM